VEKLKSNGDQAGEVHEIPCELSLHRDEDNTDNKLKCFGNIWKNLKSLRSLGLDLPRY